MPKAKDYLKFGLNRARKLVDSQRAAKPQAVTPAQAREKSRRRVEGAPTFFLTGRAKSGTSWLMRILDSHPEIVCRGEGRIFGRDYMRGNDNRSLYGAVSDTEDLRRWIERSVWARGDDVDEHLDEITALLTRHFLEKKLADTNKRIVGDKTPFTGDAVIEEMARIRPDARVIHIVRDGRDVAVSAIHHMWNHASQEGGIHELSPEELDKRETYRADPASFVAAGRSIFTEAQLTGTAKNWASVVERAMHDGPALLGDRYAETRYEDLLENPDREARRIFEFLEARADDETVTRCLERASFEKRAEGRQRGQEDSKAFLRKGVAGDWRNVFTQKDKEVFKKAAGDTLVRLGYEKNHDW